MKMKSDPHTPNGEKLLQEDRLFSQLARLLVDRNYYKTIYKRPGQRSKREMVEDKDLMATLLFVNIDGLENILESDAHIFRATTLEALPLLLVHESDPEGFIDSKGIYHPPSDGGYYVRRHRNDLLISQDKHIVTYQDRAVERHNRDHPLQPVESFEQLLYKYLPDDFTSLEGDYFMVGGRTQAALAAALTGNAATRTYVIKQSVYDGVAGKLCRFGPNGIEQEFFLNKISHDDPRAAHESFHPREPVIGVLRTYQGRDDRDEHIITPTDLGITVPAPLNKYYPSDELVPIPQLKK